MLVKIGLHGTIGGLSTELSGGDFLSGFLSSGLTAYLSGVGALAELIPGSDPTDILARALIAGFTGGVISEITGGDFESGFANGAIAHLVNSENSDAQAARNARLAQQELLETSQRSQGGLGRRGKAGDSFNIDGTANCCGENTNFVQLADASSEGFNLDDVIDASEPLFNIIRRLGIGTINSSVGISLSYAKLFGGAGQNTHISALRDIDFFRNSGMHAPPLPTSWINWNSAQIDWNLFGADNPNLSNEQVLINFYNQEWE